MFINNTNNNNNNNTKSIHCKKQFIFTFKYGNCYNDKCLLVKFSLYIYTNLSNLLSAKGLYLAKPVFNIKIDM